MKYGENINLLLCEATAWCGENGVEKPVMLWLYSYRPGRQMRCLLIDIARAGKQHQIRRGIVKAYLKFRGDEKLYQKEPLDKPR